MDTDWVHLRRLKRWDPDLSAEVRVSEWTALFAARRRALRPACGADEHGEPGLGPRGSRSGGDSSLAGGAAGGRHARLDQGHAPHLERSPERAGQRRSVLLVGADGLRASARPAPGSAALELGIFPTVGSDRQLVPGEPGAGGRRRSFERRLAGGPAAFRLRRRTAAGGRVRGARGWPISR